MTNLPPIVPYSSGSAAPADLSPQAVQEQLAAARIAAKKIRRAVSYATFDAWTIAIFAAGSFACGLIGGVSGVVLGMAMAAIAWVEFKAVARVRRLDPAAARTLAWNQLAFSGMLILYALWSLHSVPTMSSVASELGPDAGDMDSGQIDSWLRIGWFLMYGTLIAVAVFAQGGTALYYFSREKHIKEYVETQPPWVIQMQQAGAPL
jgi:hypothetical protein